MMLKDFLAWIDKDLGPWGPLVLTVAYIPLTILAVPAAVLTLGGGYLFGLLLGFLSDSIGATLGAGATFLLGRTFYVKGIKKLVGLSQFYAKNCLKDKQCSFSCFVLVPYYEQLGRSFVISKLKEYPQFNAVTIAIERSGFKIMLLLRLAPLVPFNLLNYLLSVTPVSFTDYLLASWLGMIPITIVLVYVGTTLKDISDVTRGWTKVSKSRVVFIVLSLVVSVISMICVTRVAKNALEKALAENPQESEDSRSLESPGSPHEVDSPVNLQQPLIVNIEAP